MSQELDPAFLARAQELYNLSAKDQKTDEMFIKIHRISKLYPSAISAAALMNALVYRLGAFGSEEQMEQSMMACAVLMLHMVKVLEQKREMEDE